MMGVVPLAGVLSSVAVVPRARGSSGARTPYAFALSILSRIPQRERGIWCASGNFYALDLSEGLELEPSGLVRLAFLHYNTRQEVDHVLQVRVAASTQRLAPCPRAAPVRAPAPRAPPPLCRLTMQHAAWASAQYFNVSLTRARGLWHGRPSTTSQPLPSSCRQPSG